MRATCAVLLCVYRGDRLYAVREAIVSLFAQTYQDFDIFVQEDGEVNGDIDRVLDQLLESGKIKHLGKRSKNMGLAHSLNELLKIVLPLGYQYIIRMDADDACVPNRFEVQFDFMESNKDTDVVGGWMREFNEDNGAQQLVRYPADHDAIIRFTAKRCPMSHVTAFFRRTFFEKAGLYDTTTIRNEDLALWLKGFQNNCRFHNIQEPMVLSRVNQYTYSRRAGLAKAYDDFRLKVKATWQLSLGLKGYIYAMATFVLLNLPPRLKRYAYRNFR